jgi:hypothetical protein
VLPAKLALAIFVVVFANPIFLLPNQRIQVLGLPGTLRLDFFTNHDGLGINASGGVFFPGDYVVLSANVTYNGEGVVDVLVSFETKTPVGISIVYATARTDMNGIATANFTISSEAPPYEILGTWQAIATASVAQSFVCDRLTFQVVEDPPLLGDVNCDGKVDIRDAVLLSLAWKSVVGDPNYDPRGDFNGDGEVNIIDATIIAMNWGKTLG